MNERTLYSYNNDGEVQAYSVYVKLNIRAGFNVTNLNERDVMLHHLETNYMRSKVYPDTVLHSLKPIPKNQLYFERKDICKALKGNSCIKNFSNPSKILTFLTMIEEKATKSLEDIKTYQERIHICLKKIIDYISLIFDKELNLMFIELGEILLNLKNICIYMIEDVVDGCVDILFTIKQLRASFLYDIETENNAKKSILVLMNDLSALEKRMKENDVAILFKKISKKDFTDDSINEKIEEILELPEEEVYEKLQEYIKDEQSTAIEMSKNNEEDPNIVLICEDEDSPKLSVKKTVEFIEEELVKIYELLQ